MPRGDYEAIINLDAYRESSKEWNIELQQIDMIWYDLVVNDDFIFPLKDVIVDNFKKLNEKVKSHIEKRFVYFIVSRQKVRFSIKHTPIFLAGSNNLELYVEVGKQKKLKRIVMDAADATTEMPITKNVKITNKFITFTDELGNLFSSSIHDFLLNFKCNLGIDSYVQYVGKTKIPEKRPINGAHSGLNSILYKLSNEENDIFIYYNLFKVMVSASNEKSNINFITPNSMTDEIKVEKEGDIIEKCLILHFSSNNQTVNKEKEISELSNNLKAISKNNHINKVSINYEVDDISDYYSFGSSSLKPKYNHSFCFSVNSKGVLSEVEMERKNV